MGRKVNKSVQKRIGEHIVDLIVESRVILESKAVSAIAPIHLQQVYSYLKATGISLGIVVNFGSSKVQSEGVINIKS